MPLTIDVTSSPPSAAELQARLRRARSLRHLEVQRQVRDRAEEREADDEPDRAGDRERVVPEEGERQDRLCGADSTNTNAGEQHDARDDQRDDLRGAPRPGRAAETREENDGAERGGEEAGAEVIDLVALLTARAWNAVAITASATTPTGRLT